FIAISLVTVVGQKLYYFEEKIIMTHANATEECKKMGMNLASIKSKQEREYLKEYIQQAYGKLEAYWLDGFKKNGQWIWMGHGENIETFFWHKGEPNNLSDLENCLQTWDNEFDWNDNDCKKKFHFICDIEA
ncbi:hypothetical protein DOY81_013918, partial [Sarcophaga bullata]